MQFNWTYSSVFAERNEGFAHSLSATIQRDNLFGKSYGKKTYRAINEIHSWLLENIKDGKLEQTQDKKRKTLLKEHADKNWVLFCDSSINGFDVFLRLFFKSKEDAALFVLNFP